VNETLYSRFTRVAAKVIGLVSPSSAAKYLYQHQKLRAYDAAVISGHHNETWRPGLQTGDREIGRSWKVATERSRDLDRNHPLVSDALKVGFAFTVGTALDPQWNIIGTDKKRDEASIQITEDAFWTWAEDCTINGLDWQDVKRLVYRHLKTDGEILVIEAADKFHPFKLQLIEAGQLADSIDGDLKNGNYAVRGIEFNRFGRPVTYHFYEAQPSGVGLSDKIVSVPAARVHHIFMPGRITETRGICHFVSAIMALYDQNELSDQILELHRIAAAYGIFIETEDVEDELDGLTSVRAADGTYQKVKSIGPVKVNYLSPNQKASTVKPEIPSGSFGEFDKSYLRKGARGFSMSYETFTGDFSNANFSTLKTGQNNERALFRLDSDLIIRKFCAPIVKKWLEIEVIRGLKLPNYWKNKPYYQRMRFTLPALPATDPVKDEVADEKALTNRTTNRRLICERKGIDYEENLEELQAEDATLPALPVATPAPAQVAPEVLPEDKENEDEL
jgi:lambda family phage portal protein